MLLLKTVSAVALTASTIWIVCPVPELRHPPGWRIAADPVQTDTPPHAIGNVSGYELMAVAQYDLTGRVLSTKRYWGDHHDLVPYDVALGWGPMSDQAVLDRLEISQGNRFFFYQWSGQPPIAPAEIICHASNHHIISANREIASAIAKLERGQCVHLVGELVNVSRADGFHWNTSTTRTDSGNGACEVFYVEKITVSDDVVADAALARR